jgi:SAM-dependent methyltransferase
MNDVKTEVRERYAQKASGSGCCGDPATLGYSPADLEAVPAEVSQASLGCGSPVHEAHLGLGERVLDLGSGAGFDVFLASQAVGPEGRVFGLDFTPEMLARSRASAAQQGLANVTFLEGDIESVPLPDASVDVVISNCVINLAPDKQKVFAEALRVLAPGGRFVVADMLATERLPDALVQDAKAWGECIAGAIPREDYAAGLRLAGFEEIEVRRVSGEDPCCGAEAGCCDTEPAVYSAMIRASKTLTRQA